MKGANKSTGDEKPGRALLNKDKWVEGEFAFREIYMACRSQHGKSCVPLF